MKPIHLLLLAGIMLTSFAVSAQSTIQNLYDQNKTTRDRLSKDNDDRTVKLGAFMQYFFTPTAQVDGHNAFLDGLGGGLKLYIPVFTSGNGTNGDDNTGDLTLSAGYDYWGGEVDNNLNNYPDWNAFSGMLGFRIGLSDLLFIEPQGGYTYGTYSNSYYNKYTPASVSGISWALHAGLTFFHGFNVYGSLQSTKTQAFGSPLNYGAGIDLQF